MRKLRPLRAFVLLLSGGTGVQTRMSGSLAGTVHALNIRLSALENAHRTQDAFYSVLNSVVFLIRTGVFVVDMYSGYSLHLSH